jgi:sodium-dependent dicarboxylate transporter 2/3/5
MKNRTKIIIALVLAIVAFGIMSIFFNTTQSLLIATIVLLVTLWSNDGLPLAVVSLLPIVLFPAFGI